jgi:hypothetical protein
VDREGNLTIEFNEEVVGIDQMEVGDVEVDLEGIRVKGWMIKGGVGKKKVEIEVEWMDSDEVSRVRADRVGVKLLNQRVRTKGSKVINEGYYMLKDVPQQYGDSKLWLLKYV